MYYQNPDGVTVHDGFPNPAADASLQAIDLNKLLVPHPAGTYFMRVDSNEWAEQGIYAGDLALVDKAITPKATDKVVWVYEDGFGVSPLGKLTDGVQIWGTLTAIIHQYRGKT